MTFMVLPFNIDLGEVTVFLFGIFFGIAIAFLFYLYNVLRYLRKKGHVKKSKIKESNDEEIIKIIKNAQNKFKDRVLQGETGNFSHAGNISKELALTIASHFYPKSKYPLYEISIDEAIMLFVYISKRVDDLLDRRGLRMFRKLTISSLMRFNNAKKIIDESTIMQQAEKYKVKTLAKTTLTFMNMFNPFYWGRKLIISKSYDLIIRKICLVVIGIVGEETYKIYSKNVFRVEKEIDSGLEELVTNIKEDLDKIEDDVDSILPSDEAAKKPKKPAKEEQKNTETGNMKKSKSEKRSSKVLDNNVFQKFLGRKFKK